MSKSCAAIVRTVAIGLGDGSVVVVDEGDAAIVAAYRWKLHTTSTHGPYVVASSRGKQIYLHRVITGAGKGQLVDHANGDTTDNRRANLRLCTHKENAQNRRQSKRNKSGYRGVSWDKDAAKWVARIKVGARKLNLGQYRFRRAAAKAYDAAARKHFGEFASLNFPMTGERGGR